MLMRACDIDMSGKIWEYRPASHKTQHHGKERIIFLGPQALEIIRPFLKPEVDAYLFSPKGAVLDAGKHLNPKKCKRRSTTAPSVLCRPPAAQFGLEIPRTRALHCAESVGE